MFRSKTTLCRSATHPDLANLEGSKEQQDKHHSEEVRSRIRFEFNKLLRTEALAPADEEQASPSNTFKK